jgi:hypothetical protein
MPEYEAALFAIYLLGMKFRTWAQNLLEYKAALFTICEIGMKFRTWVKTFYPGIKLHCLFL